ncbi:hypothetical protein [Streptomyces sp. NPDC050659]|uniref:hypothetical protein n=2 Tax=unclassified Streptomyces TaxID=2593676 RepID=UPI00342D5973
MPSITERLTDSPALFLRRQVGDRARDLMDSIHTAEKYAGDPEQQRGRIDEVIRNVERVVAAMTGKKFAAIDILAPRELRGPRDDAELLAAARELAVELRSKNWSDKALRAAAGGADHIGEAATAAPGEQAISLILELAPHLADEKSLALADAAGVLDPSGFEVIGAVATMASDALRGMNDEKLRRCVNRATAAARPADPR